MPLTNPTPLYPKQESLKKRSLSYLLLELLLSLTLISLCIAPLVRQALFYLRTERASLEKKELERLAHLSFIELQGQILRREIPLTSILASESCSKEKPHLYSQDILTFDWDSKITYARKVYVGCKAVKKGDDKHYYKVVLELHFIPLDTQGAPRKSTPSVFTYEFVYVDPSSATNKIS